MALSEWGELSSHIATDIDRASEPQPFKFSPQIRVILVGMLRGPHVPVNRGGLAQLREWKL